MELTTIEIAQLQQTAALANEVKSDELGELQLVMLGGGLGELAAY